jgi:hypothetical protein
MSSGIITATKNISLVSIDSAVIYVYHFIINTLWQNISTVTCKRKLVWTL